MKLAVMVIWLFWRNMHIKVHEQENSNQLEWRQVDKVCRRMSNYQG